MSPFYLALLFILAPAILNIIALRSAYHSIGLFELFEGKAQQVMYLLLCVLITHAIGILAIVIPTGSAFLAITKDSGVADILDHLFKYTFIAEVSNETSKENIYYSEIHFLFLVIYIVAIIPVSYLVGAFAKHIFIKHYRLLMPSKAKAIYEIFSSVLVNAWVLTKTKTDLDQSIIYSGTVKHVDLNNEGAKEIILQYPQKCLLYSDEHFSLHRLATSSPQSISTSNNRMLTSLYLDADNIDNILFESLPDRTEEAQTFREYIRSVSPIMSYIYTAIILGFVVGAILLARTMIGSITLVFPTSLQAPPSTDSSSLLIPPLFMLFVLSLSFLRDISR